MKIPIHKHTPVRYKMSKNFLDTNHFPDGYIWTNMNNLPLVTDITKPTYRNVMNKPMPEYVNIRQNLDLTTKPLGFWQNIKYHIIWRKK